jgi:hypothetical protein
MIDRVIFGDNQFFGINHMSQEKAREQAARFSDLGAITSVYEIAIDAGIRAFMLNSNDRAMGICDYFRSRKSTHPDLMWYPSIPYPHKYANLVAEKGILPAIQSVLFGGGAADAFGMIKQMGSAILFRDELRAMHSLVDLELRAFAGLNVRAVFLQNVITDLLLGLGLHEVIADYCDHLRRHHKVIPGLITQNLPRLLAFLSTHGIEGVAVCASFNKIGYLMSPDVESYTTAASRNDGRAYPIIAMSTLASGAVKPADAYDFIARQNIQSVVFGASTKAHIGDTIRCLAASGFGDQGVA